MNTKLTVIYVAFFALVGFSVSVTGSAAPLWALLLTNAVPRIINEEILSDDAEKTKKDTKTEEMQS